VQAFSEAFGNTKTTKYDRFAANRLSSKYGSTVICKAIELLAEAGDEPYVPVVGSVAQLETKWVSVLTFIRKRAQNNSMVDI
jgi:hypothetical protein